MVSSTPALSGGQLRGTQVVTSDLRDSFKQGKFPCTDVQSTAYYVARIDCDVNWKDVRWNISPEVYRVLIDDKEMASGKTKKMYRVSLPPCTW